MTLYDGNRDGDAMTMTMMMMSTAAILSDRLHLDWMRLIGCRIVPFLERSDATYTFARHRV